jgi:hypothetical protein
MFFDKIKQLFCLKTTIVALVFLLGMSVALSSLAGYSLYRYDIIYRKGKEPNYPNNLTENDVIYYLTSKKYQKLSLNTTIFFGSLTVILLILIFINYRKC